VHDWKSCVRETVPRVRIPPSPQNRKGTPGLENSRPSLIGGSRTFTAHRSIPTHRKLHRGGFAPSAHRLSATHGKLQSRTDPQIRSRGAEQPEGLRAPQESLPLRKIVKGRPASKTAGRLSLEGVEPSNLHGPSVDPDAPQAAPRRVRTVCPPSLGHSRQAAVPNGSASKVPRSGATRRVASTTGIPPSPQLFNSE
jgi:hypothetical protein